MSAESPRQNADENAVGDDVKRCLNLIGRVRRRAAPGDAKWLFSGATETPGRTETVGAPFDLDRPMPQRIGRFRILRRLGQGGYGIVFLAIDPDLNREVALKVPGPDVLMDDGLRRRFLREGEAAAALNHPHIVAIHEAGQVGAVHYIASEYVPGGSLATWLVNHGGPIDALSAARLVFVLAQAVQHAHSRGVLHRDIKPGNVLLSYGAQSLSDAAELHAAARLCDFGLARIGEAQAETDDTTTQGSILGTPAYMSPEQAEGRTHDVDATSDVYSIGVILYELLVGQPPFKRDTRLATLKAIWSEELTSPSRLGVSVPVDLEAICLKCLSKNQADRYQTAAGLSEDLDRYLNHRPVTARQPTRLERLARWCRRNPWLASLWSVIAAMTLLIAVGSSLAAIQLNASRREAVDHLEQAILAKDGATRSETLAVAALFEARLAQAQAQRTSGRVGQRLGSLDALAKASALIPRLNYGRDEIRLLRNEAIACLPLVDLEAENQWPYTWTPSFRTAWDANMERYALSEHDTIILRRVSDNHELSRIPSENGAAVNRWILLGPNAKYVAAVWSLGDRREIKLQVWRLSDASTVYLADVPYWRTAICDFSPDGSLIAIARAGGAIDLLSTDTFESARMIPGKQTAETVHFAPDGEQLAVARGSRIEIINVKTGEIARTIMHKPGIIQLSFSGDGQLLAAACANEPVSIWNAKTGSLQHVIGSHLTTQTSRVVFHPDGKLLRTGGYDGKARLWDVANGEQVLFGHDFGSFSRDGRWAAKATGRYRVVQPTEHHVLRQPRVPGSATNRPERISIHSGGRLLAASKGQFVLWDLETLRPVASADLGTGYARFAPPGDYLVTVTTDGLFRLPVNYRETPEEIACHIGPPERLASNTGVGYLAISGNGRKIASVDRYRRNRIEIYDANEKSLVRVAPHHGAAKWLDVSTDGRLLATATWHGGGAKIWDASTAKLLKTIKCTSARVRFSPDGTLLVVDEGRRYSVWKTANWTPLRENIVRPEGVSVPPPVAFSPDGRMLALMTRRGAVSLLDVPEFQEVAVFPVSESLDALLFSPDGTRLIAASEHATIDVWDLARVRANLKRMGLDWEQPAIGLRTDDITKPLRVELEFGELAVSPTSAAE